MAAQLKWEKLAIISVIVVIGFWVLSWVLIVLVSPLVGWAERGQFGDMFGAVNALFSGFAFAGVIVTIYMQREELRLQREELEQTREELRGQKEEMEGQKEQLRLQNETAQRQQFETLLFQLIETHNRIRETINITVGASAHGPVVKQGREAFEWIYKELLEVLRQISPDPANRKTIESTINAFSRCRTGNDSLMCLYFRNLESILRFVDQRNNVDRQLYCDIVRTQLSDHELILIFYYSLTSNGAACLKKLLEDYSFFSHFQSRLLIDQSHKNALHPHAFLSYSVSVNGPQQEKEES